VIAIGRTTSHGVLATLIVAAGLVLPVSVVAADSNAKPVPGQNEPLRDLPPSDGAWRDIRVQVVPHTYATIGAPMAGRLSEFPLRDGDRFDQGQVIARFVCAEQEGSLARAKAVLEEKRQVLATNSQLRNLGTSSGLEYRVALAQVAEATADVQTATAVVDNCVVRAPFAGRVSGISVQPQEFVSLGAPLLDILDDRSLELELIVPSRWLSWLQPGTVFTVAVDETGKSYHAAISRLSGKVDAVSQSIKAYAHLTDPAPDLLAGMSGRANLVPPPHAAQ
jgi:membrane fusion protein (multidrug efflux system)